MANPKYSIIPAGAVTDRSLEPRDLQVLCLLGRHTDDYGWCRRSQVKMAAELGCGRATVQRALERLVDAGWMQMKRRDLGEGDDASRQPSASYAYRVLLDQDEPGGGCPPAGTPDAPPDSPDSAPLGVPIDEHPGAHPERAPGAHTYAGTKNDPLERPLLERERERAREEKAEHEAVARFLAAFETRWPTAAVDDRQRTAYAAAALAASQREAALAGIAGFLAEQKRLQRKHVPAGWKYLEERRWELLPAARPEAQVLAAHPPGSEAARAILQLHEVAQLGDFARRVYRSPDGGVNWRGELTPRLLAMANAPPAAQWVALDHQQAAAWDRYLADHVTVATRRRIAEGAKAPWPWPPRKDGTVYADGDGGAAANESEPLVQEESR
ncbi:helix-turn-helix domain-containing protein [Nitrobacter sp.]|uniref:helix-turn-helix domain-containing protein n=1 Tax=Nitrobacter sp. TaxID=29420 RepID=UPI003F64C93F